MQENDLFQLVRSGWPQVMAIFYIIWWSRKIDLRIMDHTERLDRHNQRITASEALNHQNEIKAARTEEILTSIKLTLDRIYAKVDGPDRTIPPN